MAREGVPQTLVDFEGLPVPSTIGDPPMSQRAPFADQQAPRTPPCSDAAVREFINGVNEELWRSNALMVANAVLVAIMVMVGASGRRYRHTAAIRFLFLGASTLYLPIVSYVASSIGKESCSTSGLDMFCHGRSYVALLLIWTVLVQIVGTNTSAIVATEDYHGGQKLAGASIELLARTVWTSYLVFYYAGRDFLAVISKYHTLEEGSYYKMVSRFLIVLCLLSLAKIMLRFYAYKKAKQSFALGRNSRLIAGYMERLQADVLTPQQGPPPLIVMGEGKQEVEQTPHGYSIKQNNCKLVTLDMVWQMASPSTGDAVLTSQPWLKDLCLSFSLFKLLRRRFGNTHLAECGSAKAFDFVSNTLLNNGTPAGRIFNVIADEISFVRDSYYSSLPTSYFGRLLPVLNITVSFSIIAWCLGGATLIAYHYTVVNHPQQIFCLPNPMPCTFPTRYLKDKGSRIAFGNILFNALPTSSLFVAVVIAEAWEILSYLCSKWAKVTLFCNYVTHESWQQSPRVQRGLGLIMKLRKFRRSRSWSDQMGQMSLLLITAHQQQPKARYSLRRLLPCFSDQKMQHVKVSPEVKAAIVDTLRSSNGTLSKGAAALRKSRVGSDILWACQGRGTSDVILAWHIATSICLEASRHSGASSTSSNSASDKRAAIAVHLSRYCAYLVAAVPELLPDDKSWSRKLYRTMSTDIKLALAREPPVQLDAMAERLGERSQHEVVKRGVRLGKQLMELIPVEEARWDLLAGFWPEILLYVAPSDNLKAHKKAIAHGTELVTLIWALLTHAGIVTRPSTSNVP